MLTIPFITFFTSCADQIPKYTGPKVCVKMYEALEAYGRQVAEKTGSQFLSVRDVTDVQKTEFCIHLRSFDNITFEQSQILGANLVEGLCNMLKSNPEVLAYMDYRRDRQIENNVPIRHTRDIPLWLLGYRIVFWDKEMDRPKPPYIAEILFQDSHFYFYDADPQTQELRLVLKAPYEQVIAYRNEKLKSAQK
jgi:hypothetical protein